MLDQQEHMLMLVNALITTKMWIKIFRVSFTGNVSFQLVSQFLMIDV